jgi:hypothetical protein
MDTIGQIFMTLISLATLVGGYVLFPLWAARYAQRRGRDTLAMISKFSIFIAMGPLGALIALIGSLGQPTADMAQNPCPECDSREVKAELHTLAAETGEDLGTPLHLWFNSGGGALASALFIFLSWGVYTEFLEWAGFTGPVPAVIMAGLGIYWLVGSVRSIIAYYNKDNTKEIHYSCKSCQNTWQEAVEAAVIMDHNLV